MYGSIDLLLRFGHGSTHVPTAYGEFHGAEAGVVIAEYQQGACDGFYLRQFLDGDHCPVHGGYQNLAYFLFVLPVFRFIAYHDVELPLVFVKQ